MDKVEERIVWLSEAIGHLLEIPAQKVEDQIEENFYNPVGEFLNGYTHTVNGEKYYSALYVYVNEFEEVELENNPPPSDLATPVVIMTRRTDNGVSSGIMIEEPPENDKEMTGYKEYFLSEVNILTTINSPLETLSTNLALIYPELLPELAESELIFQSKKMAIAASTTDRQLSSHYHLDVPVINILNIDEAHRNVQLMETILSAVTQFNGTFKLALAKLNSMKPQDEEPISEIELWRQKSATIGTLYENMFTPDFKAIVQILDKVSSDEVKLFQQLREEVSRACLEARDNTRFLETLERHFKELQRAEIPQLPEIINSLYSAIRMVWTISRYYNTEERLQPLLYRISKEINQRIIDYCEVSYLFDYEKVSSTAALNEMEHSIKVLERWMNGYNETREKIEEQNKEAPRWEFDRQELFSQTQFIIDRLNKLTICMNKINEFTHIISAEVENVTGDISGVRRVRNQVQNLSNGLVAFSDKVYSEDDNDNDTFEDLIVVFEKDVREVEREAFQFIDDSFSKLRSVSTALDLVVKIEEEESGGDLLEQHMTTKIEKIISQYCQELQRSYDEYSDLNSNPPTGIDLPKVAGSLVWARSLFVAVRDPHNIINKLIMKEPEFAKKEVVERASKLYAKLKSALRTFESEQFKIWKDKTEETIGNSLGSPLLGERLIMNIDELRSGASKAPISPETIEIIEQRLNSDGDELPMSDETSDMTGAKYNSPSVSSLMLELCGYEMCVNFPLQLNELIDEVKILDRLGFDVGETALNVALEKEKYEKHAEGLKNLINNINSSLKEFVNEESVRDFLSGQVNNKSPYILIATAVKKCAVVIRQGFGPLNWNSLSVEDYLENANSEASELDTICKSISKTIDSINQNIHQIKNMKLTPSEEILFEGSELPYAAANVGNLPNLALSIDSKAMKMMAKMGEEPTAMYAEALKEAEIRAAAKDEHLYEELNYLSVSDFITRMKGYRERELSSALEKYQLLTGLFHKIRELANIEGSHEEDVKCPELANYYKFWADNYVFSAIIYMIRVGLQDYYSLIRGLTMNSKDQQLNEKFLKATYTPLFNIQTLLQSEDIITTPEIEQLRQHMSNQIDEIKAAAMPFVMWDDETAQMQKEYFETKSDVNEVIIKRGSLAQYRLDGKNKDSVNVNEEVYVKSFYYSINTNDQIVKLCETITDKVSQTIEDLKKYREAWFAFQEVWKLQRQVMIQQLQQLENENFEGPGKQILRKKGELTASELDEIIQFFIKTANYLEEGFREKIFIVNHSQMKTKTNLLTTLAYINEPGEPEGELEESRENPFDQSNEFDEPRLDRSLLMGLPTSNCIQSHPPYRCVIDFCIVDSTELVEEIIRECNYWRDAVIRVVIEKARPRLVDVYHEIEEEMNSITQNCNKDLSVLKSVLATIVRVQTKTMDLELKARSVQSYYNILLTINAIVESNDDIRYNLMKEYEVETENEELKETVRYVSFGYSIQSIEELLSLSETCQELCNDEVKALLNQEQIQTSEENSFLATTKKEFKTVNCKVYDVELVAVEDIERKWETLEVLVGLVDETLESTKTKFSQITRQEGKAFEANLAKFITEFSQSSYEIEVAQYKEELERAKVDPTFEPRRSIMEVMNSASDNLNNFKEKLMALNKEKEETLLAQKLFDLPLTDLESLPLVEKKIGTQEEIFELYNEIKDQFDEWAKLKFNLLDTNKLEVGCNELRNTMKKLPDTCQFTTTYEFCSILIDNYKQSIPLLTKLTSDALRERHWKRIEETCNTEFQGQENDLTLGSIIKLNLELYEEQISDIVLYAEKEAVIEKELSNIKHKWEQTHFPLKKHENCKGEDKCYIIYNLDPILSMIDEHSINLETMSSQKYVAFFAQEVREWEKNMEEVSDCIEAWINCQREFLYLEGIFDASDDLRVQLPDEFKRYDSINKSFVGLMQEVFKQNHPVLDTCRQPNRLKYIKDLITSMEKCQKTLTNYLNSKRSKYERFYFISDEELLSVLGRASNPLEVQPQIRKMFDNVASLEFPRVNNIVVGMNSPEGEQLVFETPVNIEAGEEIEEWMTKIDQQMQESLRILIKTGIYDFGHNYINQPRIKWVHKHLCEVCIVSTEVYHTWDCEEAFRMIERGDHNGMKKYLERKTDEINELVTEVRTDLTKQARIKVNTLLIVDIHNQTIIDNLIKQNTTTPKDFLYESELRFYYSAKTDNLEIVENTPPYHPYLFEYQGLCGRLVITPLTDRLNMTITTALNKRFFANPAGPAGTGKTEGVKDLAKELGRMCVVINCSEGVDVRAMGSTLSGACESGCWICFDEFNRIEPAVLSVISQEIKIILEGMAMCVSPDGKSIPQGRINLEGRDIVIRQTCGVFCTMNPGYEGRSELPDNLKALFRPIVMVKPNMNIICENMLFSEGFITARVLSMKMTVLYKLASEQLSKEFHYDFGLRALKSVLVNAGKLKRQAPDEDEERVLMRALRDMNLPKFVFEDVPLFEGLITDLCPGIKIEDATAAQQSQAEAGSEEVLTMKVAAARALKEMGMEIIPDEVGKVQQFYDTLNSRHSVMLVGPTGGGKSVIRDAYCKAHTMIGVETSCRILNPKAETVNELYGVLNLDTREWRDGLLSKIFRVMNDPETAKKVGSTQQFIYFDGDVDALWIENMNSVMDDNKLLTLPNNERIRMLDNCRLVFEVSDLQHASPATVSRCGMCWIDTKNLGYAPRYNKWVRDRFVLLDKDGETNRLAEAEQTMIGLFDKYIKPLISFIFTGTREAAGQAVDEQLDPLRLTMPITDLNMVNQFCNFFDDCVAKAELAEDTSIIYPDEPAPSPPIKLTLLNDPVVCEALYIFCIVWSLGACVDDLDKPEFDVYLKELSNLTFKQNVDIGEEVSSSQLPTGKIESSRPNALGEQESSMLYDFYYDLRRQCWISWSNFVRCYTPPPDGRFSSIFVQTLDTVRNTWILDTFAKARRNVLFVGESGTAKTTIVKTYLDSLDAEVYSSLSLNFSSRTASLEVQNALEGNLDRRTKDTLGPEGRKKLMFFIDNVSMPIIDVYGTQQPIALLKLFIERGGLYDRNPTSLSWKNVVDVQSIGCLPPPGGANNELDPRFVSLFSVLNVAMPSEEAITHIYQSILSEHLKTEQFKFDLASDDGNSMAIDEFSQRLTQTTIKIYKEIQKALSPTPSRFHYLFNLRDISRVYEGILMSNNNYNKALLLKLWRNEFTRVFCDRLINSDDRSIVDEKIEEDVTELVTESTTTSSDDFTTCLENPLIFGDFREMMKMLENYENIYNDLDPELTCYRTYEELIEGEPICKTITKEDGTKVTIKPQKQFEDDTSPYRLVRILATAALDMYDQLSKIKAKDKMQLTPLNNIVLFDDALEHLLRIHRIIRTPKGSALLIGYGGSGRRSLTRLATFMAGYKLFEIQLAKNYGEAEFKADLQRMYRDYLAPPKYADDHVVFLFTDQHVADESFLEYINNILTTGIVPGLFEDNERTQFISEVDEMARKNGCPETREAVWQYFVNSCRDRLHIVLSMSPVGETLRKRCRAFPGMISATTIDWYDSWSDDGLKVVAKTILFDQEEDGKNRVVIVDDEVFQDEPRGKVEELKQELEEEIIDFALFAHKTSVSLSEEFWTSVRRKNFVTPRNFVDFLQNYLSILQLKRNECNIDINKFKSGLEKLDKANDDVLVMNEKLTKEKVVVEAKTEEVNKMVAELSVKTSEITELQEIAETEQKELNVRIEEINKDSEEAEQQLAEAEPALDAAIKALDDITPKDIEEIQIMKVPSAVMEEMCGCVYGLMKGTTSIDWASTKQMMCKSTFLQDIVNFNYDVLNDKTIKHTVAVLKKYTKEQARASFAALVCIYTWLTNIVGYYEVYKIVAPKERNVRIQQEKKEASEKELKRLEDKITKIDAEATLLKAQLEKQQAEEKELNDTMIRMKTQLEAAEQLINDLGSEKVRWAEERDMLGKVYKNYIGDCLVTSAFMNYCGGYTNDFREKYIEEVSNSLVDRQIPTSIEKDSPVRPEQLLINDVEVLKWGSEGLPSDQLSVENGTLITRTSKWPLIIDPELQAARWLKEKEKGRKLVVVSQNGSELMRVLEQAVILGNPILIENVGEELDPALAPILEKDIHVSPTGQKQVKIGSKDVDYDNNFQLYLTTKMFNPAYAPDVFSTLCVVNHCVTENGLEAQLLNAVVKSERPEEEQKREENVKIMSDSNQSLKQYEESLLRILSQSSGPIVENYELIDALKTTKSNVNKIQQLLKSLEQTSAEIEEIRMQYMPVAVRGRVCYFAMASLAQINNMYQYSLQSFMDIFMKSLTEAAIDTNIENRIKNIINKLTENVYIYVCTGLFEKHKLMFSFLLATRIIEAEYPENTLPTAELDFFVKGDISLDECMIPNPHSWITSAGWKDLIKLSTILKSESVNQADPNLFIGTMKERADQLQEEDAKHATITSDIFAELVNDITNNDKEWKEYWEAERPEELPVPGKVGQNPFITDLQRLCILRCLRPDRVYIAVSLFISGVLGEKYITPPVLNYDFIYSQSTRSTPILFIITPGSDPLNEIIKLAQRKDFGSRFEFVALGEGESPIAESYLKMGLPRGEWILLMNAHLLPKWLKLLEKMIEPVINCESLIEQMQSTETDDPERVNFQIEELDKKYHPQFRLFLTTEPTEEFPLSILQNAIKIVTEPPNSLRLNMLQTFEKISADELDDCPSSYFRPLVYSLAFFHAAIEEREKYGKIGWNVKYDFNDSDFQISMDCLNTYLTKAHLQAEEIPWESIRYIIGEVNYGGRVMDDWDRRLINCYLEEFFGDFVFDTDNQFSFYKSEDFDYAPIPAYEMDMGLNAQMAYKKVVSQLLENSFGRFGSSGIADTEEYINDYTKATHSIKEVYEDFYINKIPLISSPEVFGLHTNAEIQYLESSTREMWVNLAELQPRVQSADSISKEDYLLNVCNTIEEKLPNKINYMKVYKKLNAKNYIMPTEIVLLEEIERFNVLIEIIKENIDDLIKALKGEIGMSLELDAMASSLYIGELPGKWRKHCPATLKALSTWLQHLQQRSEQYENWHEKGEPAVVWLSGLHIPESYLTALVQTCSRIKRWPLDRSALFTVVTNIQSESDVKQKLEFGCYIKGLFLEGAGWNDEKQCLCPSREKELMVELPLVKVIPAEASRIRLRNEFKTPVYVTSNRTNAMGVGLVFAADVQSFEHESHWVLQGVAIVLNDN